ncbi:Glycosyltransferase involved in cell wall bisynthesis [Halogranum gelatinilyticum]|uniref:Glycosyltransferase involved in cell wall bisynthesis n=1 Tax=Halogranum gelatinilyticum TaxID=660521 RepID=A0A1G9X8Q2_9EURY|nr:glycosyltransferase family 4 protein [Halogranum gelatinilyticum]SDM93162.1 Glycosyltransferase involved in cell wall bisynthesis [Halogranum gelatinilyticum]
MKIGIYHRRVSWNTSGGVSVYLQEIAAQLAKEHSVTVFSSADEQVAPKLADSDVNVITYDRSVMAKRLEQLTQSKLAPEKIDSLSLFLSGVLRGMRSDIRSQCDVLLTGFPVDDILVSNLVNIPCIFQYHSLDVINKGTKIHDFVSSSELTIANSQSIADRLQTEVRIRTNGVVEPGVDYEFFSEGKQSVLPDQGVSIVFVGRLIKNKGVQDIIKAISNEPQFQLHIIGEGEYEKNLMRICSKKSVSRRVTFHGRKPRSKVRDYLCSADIVCHPSYDETWCMTNFEAMAAGSPLITTNLDTICQYADHEENCLLVEPGNPNQIQESLQRINENPEFAKDLIDGGRKTSKKYSWESQANDICKHIRNCL